MAKEFELDEAYKVLQKGGRVAPTIAIGANGKASWWIETFDTGSRHILLQVTHASAGTYTSLGSDFGQKFVEVTDDMAKP